MPQLSPVHPTGSTFNEPATLEQLKACLGWMLQVRHVNRQLLSERIDQSIPTSVGRLGFLCNTEPGLTLRSYAHRYGVSLDAPRKEP